MRIVSLLASGTEIVCALGAGDQLVGRSHECDNPEWVKSLPVCTHAAFEVVNATSRQIDAEVNRRIRAGEPLYHVDVALINSLKPDLLITQAHCEVCAVTPGDVERAGCVTAGRVIALQAGSLAGIEEGIAAIAGAIGRAESGKRLIADERRRLADVSRAVSGRRSPTVVTLEWADPIFAMGNWGPELVEKANAAPLLGEKAQHSRAISWQRVLDANPDFLIVAPCGFDLQRAMSEIDVLRSLSGWSTLRAVQSGNVFAADGNRYFNRSGTTIADTAEIVAEIVHGVPTRHPGAWQRC